MRIPLPIRLTSQPVVSKMTDSSFCVENGASRMAKSTESTAKKVVFISSFLPRKCGIATFTSDLAKNTAAAAKGGFEPLVVALRSGDHKYEDPVKFEIRQNVKSDYICAADYINFSHVDVVSVQHEFGLFGGEAISACCSTGSRPP